MFIFLIILNAVLALAFIAAGATKLARGPVALKANGMGWVDDFSPAVVKLIGAAEVIGGVGLVLPLATNIAPLLSPIAAVCLAVVMIGAVVVHVRRKEAFIPALALTVLSVVSAALGFVYLAG